MASAVESAQTESRETWAAPLKDTGSRPLTVTRSTELYVRNWPIAFWICTLKWFNLWRGVTFSDATSDEMKSHMIYHITLTPHSRAKHQDIAWTWVRKWCFPLNYPEQIMFHHHASSCFIMFHREIHFWGTSISRHFQTHDPQQVTHSSPAFRGRAGLAVPS